MKVERITIAMTNSDAMIEFYNQVFEANLKPVPESPFFSGRLGEFDVLFCPNSIANVKAEQNRQQFRFIVQDAGGLLEKAKRAGGRGDIQPTEGAIVVSLYDPDGNSMELVEYT